MNRLHTIHATVSLEVGLPANLRLDIYNTNLDTMVSIYDKTIYVKLQGLDSDEAIEANNGVAKAVFTDPLSTYGDVEFIVNMFYEKSGDTYIPVKLADKDVEVRHLEPA